MKNHRQLTLSMEWTHPLMWLPAPNGRHNTPHLQTNRLPIIPKSQKIDQPE